MGLCLKRTTNFAPSEFPFCRIVESYARNMKYTDNDCNIISFRENSKYFQLSRIFFNRKRIRDKKPAVLRQRVGMQSESIVVRRSPYLRRPWRYGSSAPEWDTPRNGQLESYLTMPENSVTDGADPKLQHS